MGKANEIDRMRVALPVKDNVRHFQAIIFEEILFMKYLHWFLVKVREDEGTPK